VPPVSPQAVDASRSGLLQCGTGVACTAVGCILMKQVRDNQEAGGRVVAQAVSSQPELPQWLRGDPIAEHLRSVGRPVTEAAWLEHAYGSSNEAVLAHDKETREWVRRHFPRDANEPVSHV
jgi:hypothetical protein